MLKDKLQIVLITYNRKVALENTFKQIFALDSPIKNFDIIIFDNASTDGTDKLIEKYCKIFPNIVYCKNPLNIGGNANICRAFEYGVSSGKEYVWVLCDDDYIDFSNWKSVENYINNGSDVICVSNFDIRKDTPDFLADLIVQLTFVPAGIYKTKYINSYVIANMYDLIYTMFPQLSVISNFINKNKRIDILEKPIVTTGRYAGNSVDDGSYFRGVDSKTALQRKLYTNWLLGYSNAGTLFKDKNLYKRVALAAINCKDVYIKRECFFKHMCNFLKAKESFVYFLEVYYSFNKDIKREIRRKCGIYILFALIAQVFENVRFFDLLCSLCRCVGKFILFIIRLVKFLMILAFD